MSKKERPLSKDFSLVPQVKNVAVILEFSLSHTPCSQPSEYVQHLTTSSHVHGCCSTSVHGHFYWLVSLLPPLPLTVWGLYSSQYHPFKRMSVHVASLHSSFHWCAILELSKSWPFVVEALYDLCHSLSFILLSLPFDLLLTLCYAGRLAVPEHITTHFLASLCICCLSAWNESILHTSPPRAPTMASSSFLSDLCSKFILSERSFLTTCTLLLSIPLTWFYLSELTY